MNYESLSNTDEYAYLILREGMAEKSRYLPVGTRVERTEWAKQNGISKRENFGTVTGKSRDGSLLVRPDGIKTSYSYWPGFWKEKSQPN